MKSALPLLVLAVVLTACSSIPAYREVYDPAKNSLSRSVTLNKVTQLKHRNYTWLTNRFLFIQPKAGVPEYSLELQTTAPLQVADISDSLHFILGNSVYQLTAQQANSSQITENSTSSETRTEVKTTPAQNQDMTGDLSTQQTETTVKTETEVVTNQNRIFTRRFTLHADLLESLVGSKKAQVRVGSGDDFTLVNFTLADLEKLRLLSSAKAPVDRNNRK